MIGLPGIIEPRVRAEGSKGIITQRAVKARQLLVMISSANQAIRSVV